MATEYRILIEGRWDLKDLYLFPNALHQAYAFAYCLDSVLGPDDADRVESALHTYPWGGGYSYVNIYNVLQAQVPRRDRPTVASIRYASPGWIDLLLNPDVAFKVAASVGALLTVPVATAKAYNQVHKVLTDINLRRRKHGLEKTQVTEEHMRAILELSKTLSERYAL